MLSSLFETSNGRSLAVLLTPTTLVPLGIMVILLALWLTVHDKARLAERRLEAAQTQQHTIYLHKEMFTLINAQRALLNPAPDDAGKLGPGGIAKSVLYVRVEKALAETQLTSHVQSMRPGESTRTQGPNSAGASGPAGATGAADSAGTGSGAAAGASSNGANSAFNANTPRETLVVRLLNIDMPQLVRFLHATEIALENTVESATVRKNSNDFLDADVVLAASPLVN